MNRSIESQPVSDRDRQFVCSNVRYFPWTYFERHKNSVIDSQLKGLFEDLQTGRYWHVLSRIDGTNNWYSPQTLSQREEARKWARERFTEGELYDLKELCVDVALAVPFETSWPGTYIGHSILYRELVEKTDSMFHDTVSNDFRKRLNNGRFWEQIPHMDWAVNNGIGIHIVDDVLSHNFSDLESSFAPEGYEIFKRNNGEEIGIGHKNLKQQAQRRYHGFIGKIEKDKGLREEQISHLLK